jgi:hypothetical protein
MKRVLLIAANFLREQRWFLLLFVAWIFGSAAMLRFATDATHDDLEFYRRQQSGYALAVAMFTAAGAIHNERRSRRILAVLSKAVSRAEYIAGLLLGDVALAFIYCGATALATAALAAHFGLSTTGLPLAMLLLFAAAALLAAATMLCAACTHPLVATLGGMVLLVTQFSIEAQFGTRNWLPVSATARALLNYRLGTPPVVWPLLPLVVLSEVVLLWVAAALLFARRDIAVAVE